MPDGDILRDRPPGHYLKVYERLCEGHPLDSIAADLERSLVKDVRIYGDDSIWLIEFVAATSQQLITGIVQGMDIDVDQAIYDVDINARQVLAHQRGMPLTIDACKDHLLNLEVDTSTQKSHFCQITENYLWRIYDANFVECLPLSNHHNGVTQAYVDNRLHKLKEHMAPYIEKIANRIAGLKSVRDLKASQSKEKKFVAKTDMALNLDKLMKGE